MSAWKSIKLPLFLGLTCLIAGGLLTAVYMVTNPIISQREQDNLSQAFKTMYSDETATVTNTITIEDENASFTEINEVTHANGQSVVYLANSTSSLASSLMLSERESTLICSAFLEISCKS